MKSHPHGVEKSQDIYILTIYNLLIYFQLMIQIRLKALIAFSPKQQVIIFYKYLI